ncbi:MAG: glycosyltransferase family 10 [Desulfomicrobium sp.]|nr:glycosyltransferase family 10 [Desulfomicrobium sp.]
MQTIAFTNNWNQSPRSQLERYIYFTPSHNGVWKNLKAIENPQHADFLIIMDGIPFESQEKLIQHPNKIFFQREPSEIKPITFPLNKTIYAGTYEHHFHIATWMLKVPVQKLKTLPPPHEWRTLSAIMSGKRRTPAQTLRLNVLKHACELIPEIDVYGRDLDQLNIKNSYKGALNYNDFCKFKGLYGYSYSLAFENSFHANYFTEKIIDCFLSWTKPLYWGCPNIDHYFPKDSYAIIDIESPEAAKQIAYEISKPVNIDALKEARELVLEKYSLWPSIRRVIDRLNSI